MGRNNPTLIWAKKLILGLLKCFGPLSLHLIDLYNLILYCKLDGICPCSTSKKLRYID